MVDTLTPLERSVRMSRIRSKDTKPELVVRRAVWAAGFRYRLHGSGLPGRPDLVLASLKTVIFVHGCYWHVHECQGGRVPEGNRAFWSSKFETNKARDRRNVEQLERAQWTVITVWECSLSKASERESTIKSLLRTLDARRNALA